MHNDYEQINEYADWLYSGLENLLSNPPKRFRDITGSESHSVLYIDVLDYAGMEGGYIDGLRKTIKETVDKISDILAKVKDYFLGDSKAKIKQNAEKMESIILALKEFDPNTPVSENSSLRKPETYSINLSETILFAEIKQENQDFVKNIDAITDKSKEVQKSETLRNFVPLLNTLNEKYQKSIEMINDIFDRYFADANSALQKCKTPKIPSDDDPEEVKSQVKRDNQDLIKASKLSSDKVKLVAESRNSIVNTVSGLIDQLSKFKENPPKSTFRG